MHVSTNKIIRCSKWLYHVIFLGFVLLMGVASGQQIRFVAKPHDVQENDAVLFVFLESKSALKFADIQSWSWDFDGDGVAEVSKAVGNGVTAEQITTTWPSAAFNTAKGVASLSTPITRLYRPRLEIVKRDGSIVTADGVTEPVGVGISLSDAAFPYLIVRKKGVEDDTVSVGLSANPRLAVATGDGSHPKTAEVNLYAEVSFKAGFSGQVTGYEWDLDWVGPDSADPSDSASFDAGFAPEGGFTAATVKIPVNPSIATGFVYPAPSANNRLKKSVALRVIGTVTPPGGTAVEFRRRVLQRDFIVIENVPKNLSLGRAYRQGFPERYGWDDIVLTYRAPDSTGNRYVYFNHFENAFFEEQLVLKTATGTDAVSHRRTMGEVVNEILQGQSMRGLQGMVDALRMRYPRVTTQAVAERLPPPAGAREETSALEAAALDLQQSVQYAAFAVRAYGPDILRAGPGSSTPPFPQFPNYLTFDDSSLSGAPIPMKNEYWQLAGAAGALGQARSEKAKLLWRHSAQDSTALPEAKEECKVAATQSYLTMALLAAGQTADQFTQNEGNNLLANARVATDLFDKINAGVNPLGNDGSFIPNESFSAIYRAAQEAVNEAKSAELTARDDKRTFDRNQADLRGELLNQRNQFITPLRLLTGIDPATYNNLSTIGDQKDFRNAFYSRLNNLLQNYPDTDATGLGEYGSAIAAILDAGLAVRDQIVALNNLYESIKISQWANAEIDLVNAGAVARLKANDIARGYANGVSLSAGISGIPPSPFVSLSVNTGAIISGYLNAADRDITSLQQARISDIQLEAEIRKSLLQVANQAIAIRRAGVALDQAKLRLESMKAQMERYIEDLAHTRNTAADLYFQDPSFRVFASQAERRAASQLDFSVDRLYRLAKTLQYAWTEAYQNPVGVPPASHEPPALENALFDKFTKLDSLFAVRSADEAADYLGALKAWDSKLRRITGTSVRGPNHSAPISAAAISLREKVLGYKPDAANNYSVEQSIADFRNYLETNRRENFYNSANPSLELRFPIGIEDNTYFPATGSRWNLRIHSVAIDVFAESGFSDQQVAEIDLIQSGMVTLRRFFANPPAADDLVKLSFNVDNINRSAFAVAFPARINGATGNRPLTEFDSLGLADRPVGTTEWILRINTENPINRNIDLSKIKDIVIRFTYTYGNPAELFSF